jgi:hypothetical protein
MRNRATARGTVLRNYKPETSQVKNMKIAILACGAVGLILQLMDFEIFKAALTHPFDGGAFGLIFVLAYLLPAAMGAMALAKPPMQMWQAGLALAASAAFFIKIHGWEAIPHIADIGGKGAVALLANIGCIVCSAIALAKPEQA